MCDKTFVDKSNMTNYMESVHEGKKAFEFDIFDTKFSQKGNRNTHMASVHKG